LEAIAEEGSFVGAARRLGYAQSSVSQQLASFERIVGSRLIDRSSGSAGVRLTAAGALLLEHARVLRARLQAARADLQGPSCTNPRALRIGAYQSAAARLLPTVLRDLAGELPAAVALEERLDDFELLQMLADGELDACLAVAPLPEGCWDALPLTTDPYVLCVPAEATIEGPLTIETLHTLPLLSFSRCRSLERVELACRGNLTPLNIRFRCQDTSTLQELVAAGLGYALVPRIATYALDHRTRLVAVEDALVPPRMTVLVWSRYRDIQGLETLKRHCVEAATELEASWRSPVTTSENRLT
jgi:DNA-binding transcriptional LysR family regulator